MKKLIALSFAIHAFLNIASAQNSVQRVKDYFELLKKNVRATEPLDIAEDTRNENKILSTLETYTEDSSPAVRSRSYELIKRIGVNSRQEQTRQYTVELLLRSLNETDASIQRETLSALADFIKEDFSPEAKNTISRSINSQASNLSLLVRLASFLDFYELQGKLNDLLAPGTPQETAWSIRLALARMNDVTSTNYILRKLKGTPIDDEFINYTLPDLIYTRNMLIYDFLRTVIMSDKPGCESPDPNSSQEIPCVYAVIDAIAPTIKDFPTQNDKGPTQRLAAVREWFSTHTRIEIIRETY